MAATSFIGRLLRKGDAAAESATVDAAAAAAEKLQQQPPAQAESPSTVRPGPLLSGAGGGIFFFHQLGVLEFMQERYDMAAPEMAYVGASAGSLLVVLAACGVPAEAAVAGAARLAKEHGVFERPLGVAGIWGNIIRAWLDELLPPDALERCRDRVSLVVTRVPSFRQQYLHSFTSREDLLDAVLASAHIPFLLNWAPVARMRGEWLLDGSLQDFIQWKNSDLLTCDGKAFVVDYSQDEKLKTERLDFLGLKDEAGARHLMALGHAYAARNADRIHRHFHPVARHPDPSMQKRPVTDGTSHQAVVASATTATSFFTAAPAKAAARRRAVDMIRWRGAGLRPRRRAMLEARVGRPRPPGLQSP
eukprot:CAMPEP_0206138018 /NCGR_PEP_ID=MMETSP1473-20131121/3011_1 /ASSEMBLY_ACC=CAM_ASM_001109 /TAXON_ID=1461547 /ORGANISM="Stichococcus sp, Strain RCC1054" /LENGTH=361 /DNA_ID=CAMNT_0053531321 /DNA_START=477 /DNA_END=1562 /DNA_ORIENTATION=+